MSNEKIDRAKKIKETLANAKNMENTSNNVDDDKIDIQELDASLNNHKSFTDTNKAEQTTGWVESESEIVEVDPDKVVPPVARPSSEKLEERSYSKVNRDPSKLNEQEPIIPEPQITQPVIGENPVDPASSSGTGTTTSPAPETSRVKPDPINKEFGDMSPSEKRKNAEKTAEVILTNYAQVLPILPKMLSKYNMHKMELLDMKEEIRLSMQVNEEGLTIRDYMMFENEKADKVFTVTEDMKDEVRPALIDVIMEKGAAMTPMNRLLSAVGGQLVLFLHASGKMFMEHRSAMSTFKEFKAQERAGFKGEQNNNGGNNGNNSSSSNGNPVNPNPPVTPQSNGENNSNDSHIPQEKEIKIEEAIVLQSQSTDVQIIEEN